MGELAAHQAGVRLDHPHRDAHAREGAMVGLGHHLVAAVEPTLIRVEAVGVLHDELAAAEQAKPRADLIAELRGHLVEVHRKLAVGVDLIGRQESDHLLVRGSEHAGEAAPVLKAEEFFAVVVPASGALPQLAGLDNWHQDLLGARGIHLFADDLLDLPQDAPHERQVGVDAAGEAANVARAEEQLVADQLRLAGHFAQSWEEQLRGPQSNPSESLSGWRYCSTRRGEAQAKRALPPTGTVSAQTRTSR